MSCYYATLKERQAHLSLEVFSWTGAIDMVKKKITEGVTANDSKSKRWRAMFSVARMAYESGEFRQAESLLARALELAKQLPEHSFAEQTTQIATAAVYLAEDRLKEAEGRLEKSISELRTCPESTHKELLAVALRFHAQSLANRGDDRDAEKELLESANILKDLGSDGFVQWAYTLCDLCGLYVSQGRLSEAEHNIVEAMRILGVVFGTECPEYVRADMIYTVSMPMQDDTRMEAAGDGIVKMEYMYGAKHPNIKRAFDRYAKVLNERGESTRLHNLRERFCIAKA